MRNHFACVDGLFNADHVNLFQYRTLQQIFKQAHTDYKNAVKQKGEKDLEEVRNVSY